MKRQRQSKRGQQHRARRSTVSVARLVSTVRQLRRRVARLEGRRERIGFRARRDEIDTEAIGEMVELAEEHEHVGEDGDEPWGTLR